MRILAVDDEPLILSSLRRYFALLGHHMTGARSAEEALGLVEDAQSFDLVLSDVEMPGMDGFTLRTTLLARHPELPVLLVSGDSRAMEAAMVAGVPFLAKPWSLEELEAALRRLHTGFRAILGT